MPTPVASTSDIRTTRREIGGRDAEVIRAAIENGAETVAWVAEWLSEEKALEYAEGSKQVAVVRVDRETEKAWGVLQPGDNELIWLPKSQAELFILEPSVDHIESNQSTLGGV